MKEIFIRTPFNYDRNEASDESGLKCVKKTRTQQQFKEETDINTIVRRFGLTGKLPENTRIPEYADYEGVFDFQTALNAVMDAEKAFMMVPSNIRREFDNDPGKFLEFCENKENLPKLREWKLAKPLPEPSLPVAAPAGQAAPQAAPGGPSTGST